MSDGNEIWAKRLKDARLAGGLSQKQLGIQAGLDPSVASTRINRYELGVHKADYLIAKSLAAILDVPAGYFYTEEEGLAELMLHYHRLSKKKKSRGWQAGVATGRRLKADRASRSPRTPRH